MRQISDLKIGAQTVARDRAFAHQTANANGLANGSRLGRQFAGRTEKHDIVFERGQGNKGSQRQKSQATANCRQSFACVS